MPPVGKRAMCKILGGRSPKRKTSRNKILWAKLCCSKCYWRKQFSTVLEPIYLVLFLDQNDREIQSNSSKIRTVLWVEVYQSGQCLLYFRLQSALRQAEALIFASHPRICHHRRLHLYLHNGDRGLKTLSTFYS